MGRAQRGREPIAIVGVACRFAGGADSPARFWDLLEAGRDAVGVIGSERWSTDYYHHPEPQTPGRSYTWAAGALDSIDTFDARFFGISPREAAQMDPQQRILLELAWEALEDGGQVPSRLAGSPTAVYVGISSMDYGNRRFDDPASGDGYFMLGTTLSIAANRISYQFDLRGPSMAIDTACSSSLVALHTACQSLWRGESSAALAGGMHLLLNPFPYIGFSAASMLSPDGRCKAFDASANGYVRGEGGALVFLKPLSLALADGDPVRAVILSTVVNSDGCTSALPVPGREAQSALLRDAYRRAGVARRRVAYVEAHGTGTAVGDPIEADAIGRVLGQSRGRTGPLLIGSVKTNIGHLEPASGMAGLVKVVLAAERRIIPPSLHFDTPNPAIPFDALNLRVVTESTPLGEEHDDPVFGVNSFGFGGANAHVVVAPFRREAERKMTRPATPLPVFLSARSEPALRALARECADCLEGQDAPSPYDFAWMTNVRRERHPVRLAVVGDTRAAMRDQLVRYAAGEHDDGWLQGVAGASGSKLAMVFSGNGSQWSGMGRRLLAECDVFRDTVVEVNEHLRRRVDFSIIDELMADAEHSRLALTEVAQPALFAVQLGLFEQLRSWGLEPDAVLGHSVGEVAAARASGALDLDDAVEIIYQRSQAQALTQGLGRMAALGLGEGAARALIAEVDDDLEIAAINSASAVTVAGTEVAIARLAECAQAAGALCKVLDLEYAFHSRQMDRIEDRLATALANVGSKAPERTMISTVTGSPVGPGDLDAAYWWHNVRRPVQFAPAVSHLVGEGFDVFVEVGPRAILRGYVQQAFVSAGRRGVCLPTIDPGADGATALRRALCQAHVHGKDLDFERLFPSAGRCVSLPTYPWQRERHWYASTTESLDVITRRVEHPLLGFRRQAGEPAWESQIDLQRIPWLADHRIGDAVLLPAAAYLEMAFAASRAMYGSESAEVEGLEIRAPIVLETAVTRVLRFSADASDGSFRIEARERLTDDPWTVHAVGRVTGAASAAPLAGDPKAIGGEPIGGEAHYARIAETGLDYGPAFRSVRAVWGTRGVAAAEIGLPDVIDRDDARRYLLHPSLLDGCFQTLVQCLADGDGRTGEHGGFLPVRFGRARLFMAGAEAALCEARVIRRGARTVLADVVVLDRERRVIAAFEGCGLRRVDAPNARHRAPATYEYRTLIAPREGPQSRSPVPGARALVARTGRILEATGTDERRRYGEEVAPLLDALVGAFAHEAFAGACADGATFALEALADGLGIEPERRPWLARLLWLVAEDGGASRVEDGHWRVNPIAEGLGAAEIWQTLVADYPQHVGELALAAEAGLTLKRLLGGESSVETRRGPAPHAVERLVLGSPAFALNATIEALVAGLGADWPENRRLRLLEVSGLGSWLLPRLVPHLPPDRFDCTVLALDERQERRAAALAQQLPRTRVVKLGEDGGDAGPPHDLVLVGNLGVYPGDAVAVLERARTLTARGGAVIVRDLGPGRLWDLVFGDSPGWWRERGADRPVGRLRSPATWRGRLERAGFSSPIEVLDPAGTGSGEGFLLVAHNASAPVRVAPDGAVGRSVLVLTDETGVSAGLAACLDAALSAAGARVITAVPGPQFGIVRGNRYTVAPRDPDSFAALWESLGESGASCTDVVHLMGYGLSENDAAVDPSELLARRGLSALHLAQALIAAKGVDMPSLWLVTSGAGAWRPHGGGASDAAPGQAPLWGLGRVLMNEAPRLRTRMIDLAPSPDVDALTGALVAELLDPGTEDEIVLGERGREVLRLRPLSDPRADAEDDGRDAGEDGPVRLEFASPGSLDNVRWTATRAREPGPGEIAIVPRATGLNFRDVMFAMGLLPDEALESGFAGATLGLECAGDVVAVGHEVVGFRPGDPVVCFGSACFSSRVVTTAAACAHKPPSWSYEQAATVPTAFFTAYYALKSLAALEPGERVLVHGAAGGVGIAALQYARFRGAEVFATAGSPEKRDFLRMFGADHVFDSRSLAFEDEILELTGGAGVDVVLNCISGEAVRRNLRLLRPFGRFLELGKRDYYENTRVGLRPFRNNISYHGIDADQLLNERPKVAAGLFREVMRLLDEGVFAPLPYRAFASTQAREAFRYMQKSQHIGKVVVSLPPRLSAEDREPVPVRPLALVPEATYLVTGGTGGFGLATARWLAGKGARHLALVSRRGASSEEARAGIGDLERLGVEVSVLEADVSDRRAVRRIVAQLAGGPRPLRGIVHAAAVFDDGLVESVTAESFEAVMGPKAFGAWYLHEATRSMALDFFVLYSSATTSFGNPGQANYVAANAYLEALAAHRRACGLPALAVSWGPIGDAGYLARRADVRESLGARLGSRPMSAAQALDQLERLLAAGVHAAAVVDIDWRALRRVMPAASAPKFELLAAGADHESGADAEIGVRELLAGCSVEEAEEVVVDLLKRDLGRVLGLSSDDIDERASILDLGLDSLMAMELRASIQEHFEVEIPAAVLSEGATVARIAARIVQRLLGGPACAPCAPHSAHRDTVSHLAEVHGENLAEEEIARLVDDVSDERRGSRRLVQ